MLKKRFAVVKEWNHTVSAEDECLQRIKHAALEVGYSCEFVDQEYRRIEVDSSQIADEKNFDFVIHIHFCSSKINNLFSFVALWNPEEFYHSWGYRQYSDNLMTHDDFLTCGSVGADSHLRRLLVGDFFHKAPRFELYHSLQAPKLVPERRTDRRFHYCGMNWEKLTSKKGRHDDLLRWLDSNDLIDIYGPEKFQGVRPWEGFKCYRGEIPFDGHSMIQSISNSGIALVLSSEAHIRAGMMSNRLFEAMAAGVPIVCDKNPKAREIVGDNAFYVDTNDFASIERIFKYLNSHPDEAYQKACRCQEIWMEKYRMSDFLKKIYSEFEIRKSELDDLHRCEGTITAIFVLGYSLEEAENNYSSVFDQIKSNLRAKDKAVLIVPSNFKRKTIDIESSYEYVEENICINGERCLGPAIAKILENIKTDYFSIVMPNERVLKNHFSSLAKTLDNSSAEVAASDYVLRVQTHIGINYQAKQTRNLPAINYLSGAYLFRRELISQTNLDFIKALDSSLVLLFLLGPIKLVETRKFSLVLDHFDLKNLKDIERLYDLRASDTLKVLNVDRHLIPSGSDSGIIRRLRNHFIYLRKYPRLWRILRIIGRNFA